MNLKTKQIELIGKSSMVLLLILAFIPLVPAQDFADLGESCQYSRDCAEGFCQNSTCRFPPVIDEVKVTGICSKTADCFEGFCKDNQCILPDRKEFEILQFGIKSGCAGIIENCTGILCSVCNISWVLLVVGTIAAAFVSRKRGRRVLLIMLVLPVITGLLFFPILGFIVALIELFAMAVLKSRRPSPPIQGISWR